ncbi:MAG TPA: hypothetical protein P5032_16050 [Candidatus Competibacter sp.]|nr:hypothetical protein [Candidatus Competibacteraceae bacterium]HRW67226.1 hypothetical protein [Candidatus Competibacter sp.]
MNAEAIADALAALIDRIEKPRPRPARARTERNRPDVRALLATLTETRNHNPGDP